MIKEAYCSYEVAKLLKEKGFDEVCIGYYSPNRTLCFSFLGETNSSWLDNSISAPTHQMALAWLREKGVFINISVGFPYIDGKKVLKYFWMVVRVHENHLEYPMENEELADTYEEAVEAAICYALKNLI